MTEPTTNRRRWLRYSMRTLLVVVTLLCIWLGLVVSRAERQRQTVAALRAMNAQVFYDTPLLNPGGQPANWRWLRSWIGDDYFDDITYVSVRHGGDDDLLRRIADLRGLTRLDVHGLLVTDEGLVPIAQLPKLEILAVFTQEVTDDGMRILARAPALRKLVIRAPKVTDQGVMAICQLGDLEGLHLHDTQITEVGLKAIGTLGNLQNLGISDVGVTETNNRQTINDGLKYIAVLPKLEKLVLHNSSVTDQGLAQLGAAGGLRDLYLNCSNPAYSTKGVRDLQSQLPNVLVTHSIWAQTLPGLADVSPTTVTIRSKAVKR
jgi:hypothetical protein